MKNYTLLLLSLIFSAGVTFSQGKTSYMEPPEEIKKLVDAPPAPSVLMDEEGKFMIFLHRSSFKSIDDLAADEYRLAGVRINPKTNGPSRARYYKNITYKGLEEKEERTITGMPSKAKISNISWSPDFSKLAFTNEVSDGIELWVVDLSSGSSRKVMDGILNDLVGNVYEWWSSGQGFICKVIDDNRGELMGEDRIPAGPVIQSNDGKKAAARTYQDLLQNVQDEHNFKYFVSSKLIKIDLDGNKTPFLEKGLYTGFNISPDGKYVMVSRIKEPFSYLVPYYRFPTQTDVVDFSTGKKQTTLIDAPLEESRAIGFGATSKLPRNHSWRADHPATVYWVEALDDGDPANDVEFRDEVFMLKAPFTGKKQSLVKSKLRFGGITWGNEKVAILQDNWWSSREHNVYTFSPGNSSDAQLLFALNTEDYYGNPGYFLTKSNFNGFRTLQLEKDRYLYLRGEGYSPEGNRPFLDKYDLRKKSSTRLWRADGKSTYESIVDVLDISKGTIITRVESKTQNPNYFVRDINKNTLQQVSFFENPYESFSGVKKQQIKYKREDGVDLTADLYLPAGFKPGTKRLPVFLWAYPREFKNAQSAGQVKSSPHTFVRLNYGSAIFWAMRGYAVLDRTDFPIIGEGDEEPNDTFVEQLIANAAAAIDELVKMSIADPNRVGVGGHSYGAFMTANLLAHSDLFAAGIARSGAYNRTLTPFGFQREERTFWEAPEVYFKMSPFMHADKINEPLLLVHGTHDNNSGTFPMQSDRLYNAVKGHGGVVRLVKLPYESHGYAARESIMHMLWEMDSWLEEHVKNNENMSEKIEIDK